MRTQHPTPSASQMQASPPASIRATGYFSSVQIYLSPDGEFIIHRIPGGGRVQKHANLYRHLLGLAYERRGSTPRPTQRTEATSPILGFVGDARVVLTRDRQYLIHFLPEGRITQPAEVYRQLLLTNERDGAGASAPVDPVIETPAGHRRSAPKDGSNLFGDA